MATDSTAPESAVAPPPDLVPISSLGTVQPPTDLIPVGQQPVTEAPPGYYRYSSGKVEPRPALIPGVDPDTGEIVAPNWVQGMIRGGKQIWGQEPVSSAPEMATDPELSAAIGLGASATPSGGALRAAADAAEAVSSRAESLLGDYEKAGVDPRLAAISQNKAVSTGQHTLSRLPFASGVIDEDAANVKTQLANAAERNAAGIGTASAPVNAGSTVQQAVTDFARGEAPAGMSSDAIIASPTRASSFTAKSDALYDRFSAVMPQDKLYDLSNTLDALKGPMERFPTSPELGAKITNPRLKSFFDALSANPESVVVDPSGIPIIQKAASGGELTFPEIKEFRSYIGRMISDPMLISDIPRADLKGVYAGLSRDMENAASSESPVALQAFNRANGYYNAGMGRIDQLEKIIGKGSPESVYQRINGMAGGTGSADIGGLTALKRSMDPSDWGQVGSAMLRQMGKPTPGQADALAVNDFSPGTLGTNWARLSNQAKEALFGAQGTPQRDNLDSLMRVAAAEKNVARTANVSNTAHVGAMLGTLGAFKVAPVSTSLALLGSYGAAKALTSPALTRYLYSAPKEPGAFMAGLNRLALSDPMARQAAAILGPKLLTGQQPSLPGQASGGRVNEPTEAQKQAGNYSKDHIRVHGLDIAIENRKGSVRRGTGKDGKPWAVQMPADYGYIKRTEGADGDHVDVYVGPHRKAPVAYVINQLDHTTGKFDEHKIMLAFANERQALATYRRGFSDGKGAARIGGVVHMPIDELKSWLDKGKRSRAA